MLKFVVMNDVEFFLELVMNLLSEIQKQICPQSGKCDLSECGDYGLQSEGFVHCCLSETRIFLVLYTFSL